MFKLALEPARLCRCHLQLAGEDLLLSPVELDDLHEGKKGVFIFEGEKGDVKHLNWVSDGEASAFLGIQSALNEEVTVIVDENGNKEKTVSVLLVGKDLSFRFNIYLTD
mgnify:CR=1 FL=1